MYVDASLPKSAKHVGDSNYLYFLGILFSNTFFFFFASYKKRGKGISILNEIGEW